MFFMCSSQKPRSYLMKQTTYFPTTMHIQNHVYTAQKALELSKFDQDNLRLKINEWKKVSPCSSFHLRPYTDDNNEENLTENLLYVQHEKWEAELLARYGNSIALMDATYKQLNTNCHCFLLLWKPMSDTASWLILLYKQRQLNKFLRLCKYCKTGIQIGSHHAS